jgi:hypothetical protein
MGLHVCVVKLKMDMVLQVGVVVLQMNMVLEVGVVEYHILIVTVQFYL